MYVNVDFSGCIAHSRFHYLNICGPMHAGKTAYLNALREYHAGKDEQDSESDHDRHFVIFLDFSDFVAIAYIDALNYFRKKMSELYLDLYEEVKEELRYFETLDRYLDVIEGECDDEALKKSLVDMVRYVRYGKRFNEYYFRPMILIDEISRPLLYAARYGYLDEMEEFYDAFLEIDHYEMTAGIVTTSFAPANTDVHFGLKYITDVPVNEYEPMKIICQCNGIDLAEPHREGDYWIGYRYFDEAISLKACFEELIKDKSYKEPPLSRYEIELSREARSLVTSKRIWVINKRYEHEESEKKKKAREKLEFSQPLASGFMIPSDFAGVRELNVNIEKTDNYKRLNTVLRKLYDKHGNEISSRDIYDEIQHIGKCYKNDKMIKSTIEKLKDYADSKECFYRCWIDINDSHWARFDLDRYENDKGYGDMALVKVYISVSKSSDVLRVFEDVVRFLIDNGKHLFHAKTSLRKRSDHICLWLAREDFFLLEKYVEKYEEILVKPLDFVAYRGKLGITREFHSWSSHNGLISELIETYLKNISSRSEIDVVKMFSDYVRAWNGDLDEDNAFSKEYRKSNAQELIIMLESLKVILSNSVIEDDNILLSGDGSMWCLLGESKNWYEVGVNAKREKVLSVLPA